MADQEKVPDTATEAMMYEEAREHEKLFRWLQKEVPRLRALNVELEKCLRERLTAAHRNQARCPAKLLCGYNFWLGEVTALEGMLHQVTQSAVEVPDTYQEADHDH